MNPKILSTAFLLLLFLTTLTFADEPEITPGTYTPPKFTLPATPQHPALAATKPELLRLKSAWNSTTPEHDVLAARFAKADAAIKAGITFPPEGGQHNQWYQCEKCQTALKTIDATHHQCPICGKIYSGFPYDNVLYSKIHSQNSFRCEDAAWAYAATGDKKYSDFVAQMLTGYADRYLKYPMVVNNVNDKSVDVAAGKLTKYKSAGHIDEQTLGEAMLMIPYCISYDLIYNSPSLNDDQKKHIETGLIRPMADCMDINRMGKSNWQTWHNAAGFYAGVMLNDQSMVDQSLLDSKNGFAFQMNNCVSKEGLWFENSWGYHYYTLMALTDMAEGARRLGLDLYSTPALKKMYLLPFDYRMSDGSLPRFGDAVQESVDRPNVNEAAYAVYQDDRLLTSLPAKPSFDSILLGRDTAKSLLKTISDQSELFEGAGHAILRTDGPGKLSAAFTFSPFGGFHSHFDKLSFVLFAYNQELAIDPGRAESQAYRLDIHQNWYRATTGHNAVLVDGQGQNPADGKLISYNANASYAAVAADAGKAFPNVNHKRLLILTPTYALVIDQLTATDNKEHTFDFLYHNTGKSLTTTLPEGAEKLGEGQGFTYLNDIKNFTPSADKKITATFTNEKVDTHLTLLTQPNDQFFTATGPVKSVTDRAPMLILRRKGKDVTFVTVIDPTEPGKPSAIKSVSITFGDVNRISDPAPIDDVTINRADATDHVHNLDHFGENVHITTATPNAPPKEVLAPK